LLPVETIGSDLEDGVLEDPIRSSRRLSASNYHDLTLRFKLAGELSDQKMLEWPWHPQGHPFKYDE
jgi:hypothetical protein